MGLGFENIKNYQKSLLINIVIKIDWYWISEYQTLSEKFIEKYSDKIYWGIISKYQKLSEEVYYNKVNWYWISSIKIIRRVY